MLPVIKYAPGHRPPGNPAFPRLSGVKVTRYFQKLDELSPQAQGPFAPMIQRKQSLTDIRTARVEATIPMAQVRHGLEHWYDTEEWQGTSTYEPTQPPRSEEQHLLRTRNPHNPSWRVFQNLPALLPS